MALITKTRPENALSTWESIFPNSTLGVQQSTVFVKKLLAIAVSNITYLRTIFPEAAFGDKKLENMNLKVLKEDGKCPGAFQLIQWVKDPSDSQTAIETYTFRFSYAHNSYLEIYRNERKIASSSHLSQCEDVKRATIKLLRSILVLTQTLDPLPNDVYMAIKLFYLDDVTPPDYHPNGFEANSSGDFSFKEEAFLIDVGRVETPFHDIQMRVKALSSNFDEEQIEPADTPKADDITKDIEVCVPSNMDTSSLSQVPVNRSAGHLVCPCGVEDNTGLILTCSLCSIRQHAVCFGILESTSSTNHVCENCTVSTDNSTEHQLARLSVDEAKSLCIWRRCLQACSDMSTITQNTLTRKMLISPAEAGALIHRLCIEEFISSGKKPYRYSPTPLLHSNGLVKYFTAQKQVNSRRVLREILPTCTNKLNKRKLNPDTRSAINRSELYVKKRKGSKCINPISSDSF
ncbi:hypothetical protein LOD99_5153 [Oopsacas minuta]|uniref:HORMA domain-containing protein n=1 Tax=Oopsacas minuta TaxID=111878 RepID=A0AAV7JT67_9METZ|nr:hypothetical protein LOD99_5153 [Oopsacas minuta]